MALPRLSGTQKIKMVEFFEKEENICLLRGNTHLLPDGVVSKKWKELTSILNSCGSGAQKTPNKWKKTLIELKYAVKKKQRALIAHNMAKGGGSNISLSLNDFESRLLNLYDKKSMDGEPSTIVHRLDTPPIKQLPEVIMKQEPEDYSKDQDSFVSNSEEVAELENISSATLHPKRKKLYRVKQKVYKSTPSVVEVAKFQSEAMSNIVSGLNKMAQSQQAMTVKVMEVADEFLKTLKNINNYLECDKNTSIK